jgi:hypothetical protein
VRTETYIRTAELGVALASTYMVVVTLLQSSIYVSKLKPFIMRYIGPFQARMGVSSAYFDLVLLGMVLMMSFVFWRRGDEVGFGRLFTLNMLMFFAAVVDFSIFNWVNLILPYDPTPQVTALWVFGVGLLLQATYLTLRYTVRFRLLRDELTDRGAKLDDVDEVSKGQMTYLTQLVGGTAAICAVVFYLTPIVRSLLRVEASGLPYPHIVIGVICSLLIAAATILYLRSGARRHEIEEEAPTIDVNKTSNRL